MDGIAIGIASTPVFPNPQGAGVFQSDTGVAPTGVVAGTFTTLEARFTFGTPLAAGDTSKRLVVTYTPLDSALANGSTVNFDISSGSNFTVQGILAPRSLALRC